MMTKKRLSAHTRNKLLLVMASLAITGCATEQALIPPSPYKKPPVGDAALEPNGLENQGTGTLTVDTVPVPPSPSRLSTIQASPQESARAETADISLNFDQIPLPTFIQLVFGTILKKNYSVDPQITARTDLVTLRTGARQTPSQVLEAAKMLLKTYGIAVTEMGGFYRITPDSNLSGYAPEIRRGRAQPEVPLPLRPVFQLVELSAVRTGDVSLWLRSMFGQKLNVQEDPVRNALMLSGQSADITAALEAIQVLDQPLMRGRTSRRLTPNFLSADELGRKLIEILTAEGYVASTSASVAAPITLIPIPASNSLILFSVDPAVIDHIVAWSQQLDTSSNSSRGSGGYFTYPVKYADAQDLAKTMQDLIGAGATAAPAATTTAAGTAQSAAPTRRTGRIVVNSSTNTLIFLSTQEEFSQLLSILKELDQPAKSALIEVTVAEVRLSDKNQLGIEWDLNPISRSNGTIIGGTAGGLGLGTGGLTLKFLNNASQVKATLNAMASNNRANIISTPRIMARNGEVATIQVGQEVPIITSQQSNANTTATGGTGGILQTIQYRNTGVILKVKPVIHAGNRIELEVSQEVSAASETTTGVNSSPTISNRKVDTKLSIRDGATVLLGGLISTNTSKGETGIPVVKDIPVFGQLFRNNTDSSDKTELIILITPYVIEDDLVAEQVTQAFRNQLGWAQSPESMADTSSKNPEKKALPNPPLPKKNPPQPVTPQATPQMPRNDAMPVQAVTTSTPVSTTSTVSSTTTTSRKPVPQNAPLPPGISGKPATDPALLEELRKAAAQNGAAKK